MRGPPLLIPIRELPPLPLRMAAPPLHPPPERAPPPPPLLWPADTPPPPPPRPPSLALTDVADTVNVAAANKSAAPVATNARFMCPSSVRNCARIDSRTLQLRKRS